MLSASFWAACGVRLTQALRRTLRGMGGSLGHSALVTLTLWAALLVVGLFAVAVHNLEGMVGRWGQDGHLGVTLCQEPGLKAWEETAAQLAKLPGVREASLVTPAAALQRFRARGAAAAALVEGVGDDLLPPLVEVGLTRRLQDVQPLLAQIRALPGVQEVDTGLGHLSALQSLVGLLRWGSWVFGSAVLLAAALICANTLRLVVHGHGDEIAMLQLVGATANFVRLPYVLQGVLWGALASLLADLSLYVLHRQVAVPMSRAAAAFTGHFQLHFITLPVAGALLVCGVVLGGLGSALAVQRYLHAKLL